MREFLENFSVDLNEVASDVIVYNLKSGTYTNKTTGKTGAFNEIIRDRRFIELPENTPATGYYVYHDKEHDFLIAIGAKYDDGWVEEERHIFWWNREKSELFHEPVGKVFDYSSLDICGQVVSVGTSTYDVEIRAMNGVNVVRSGAVEAFNSFFTADLVQRQSCFIFDRPSILMLLSSASNQLCGAFQVGGPYIMGSFRKFISPCENKLTPLPEEAIEMMKKYIISWMEDNSSYQDICYDMPLVCCLQHVPGQGVFQRVFRASVALKFPVKNSSIYMIEHQRGLINKNSVYVDDVDVVYMNDMCGTFLEHTAYLISDWIKILKENFGEYSFYKIREYFEDKHIINSFHALKVAKLLAENPVCEMMFKYTGKNEFVIRSAICYLLEERSCDASQLSHVVGELYDGKLLHEILGVPKCTLECVPIDKWLGGIAEMKRLFNTLDAREYFLRMNRDDVEMLYDFLDNAYSMCSLDTTMDIMKKLILLHGYRNWKGYIAQVRKVSESMRDSQMLVYYNKYLFMLFGIGEAGKKAEWKLSGDALKKSYASIKEVYDTKSSNYLISIADAAIEVLKSDMDRMTYKGDKYLVTYPKNSDDIINEGVSLKHCAKDFINEVGYKSTTKLLFIRRIEKPDKPFYTLEVKDGEVRQCHGFDNCNIDAESGLEKFLKEYCEAKSIKFSVGESRLGPDI